MKTYKFDEAIHNLSEVFDQAEIDDVQIERDGKFFILQYSGTISRDAGIEITNQDIINFANAVQKLGKKRPDE